MSMTHVQLNRRSVPQVLVAVVGYLITVLSMICLGGAHVLAAPIQQYSGGLIVYADGTAGTPKYKTFDDTTGFGTEQSATAVGTSTIEWIRVAASPVRDEWIIVTRDAEDDIIAQVCTGVDGGVSCGATTTITATAGTHGFRNYDVAYEQSSGDALIVYGTATADELRKIEWNGSSWTGDAAITTTRTSGTVEWVELTSRPASDQIAIGYSDSNDDVSAYRWSGTTAGDEATSAITTSGSTGDVRKFDVSFEGTSGDMIVAAPLAGAGTTALGHMTSAGTWTIVANTEPDNITSFIDLQEVGPDDDVAMLAYGTSTANNPTEGYELNGATPNTTTTGMVDGTVAVDTTTLTWVANYMPVSVAYLSSTYYAVGIFSDVTGADDINWFTMDSAGVWKVQADNTRTRGTIRFSDIFDYPNANKVLLLSSDANSDLWADTWTGAATGTAVWTDVTSGGAVETALSSATTDVYDFAFRMSNMPASISGILYETDRTTTATSGYAIKLAVGTSSTPTVYSATTTSGGAWTFSSINVSTATSGTPYVIWLDGSANRAATLLSGNASSSASGIPLYEGHLTVNGSTTGSAVNLTNFSFYDSTDDTDIPYTISGTAATTTADFFIRQGVFTPTATFAVLGDYTNNGTFTHASGTVLFGATTTAQRINGTLTGTSAFNDVLFTGNGSSLSGQALGFWTFDSSAMTFSSATVGTSTDVSGHGHDGTLENMSSTTDVVTGYSGNGLYFDGSNNDIRVSAASSSLDGLSVFTACVWVNPASSSVATYPQIMSTYNAAGTTGWDMYLIESGADFGFGTSFLTSPSTFTYKEIDDLVPADQWSHLCIKQNGDSLDNIEMYRNGARLNNLYSGSENGTRDSDTGNDFHIGNREDGTYPFKGTIDESAVYGEYLTDAQIFDLYNLDYNYYKIVYSNASTTDFTVKSDATYVSTSSLTVFGDYTAEGIVYMFEGTSSTFYLTGSGVTATGTMTALNLFPRVVVAGSGQKSFGTGVEVLDDFTVLSTSGEVIMPPSLNIGGDYMNNSTTTHAGAQWVGVSVSGDNEAWNDITFGNGIFVAISESGERIMTSSDGITWSSQTAAGDDDSWSAVTYGNGLFVAVSYVGDRVITSPDGVTWTVRTAAGDNDLWSGIAYGNGRFVAVGVSPGDVIMTSPDGITWTVQSSPSVSDSWYAITYGNGLFVALGDSTGAGNSVMTSPDGQTWTAHSAAGDDDNWYGVVYGNGVYVGVGASGGGDPIISSPDGITWTVRTAAGDNDDWVSVVYGNGLFVAVSPSGDDRVVTSVDGINWTPRTAVGTEAWYGIAYGNSTFVAVSNSGSGESFMISTDGILVMGSDSAQTLSGNMTGASQLRSVLFAGGTKTFNNNASTTTLYNYTLSGEVVTPEHLTVSGDFDVNAGSIATAGVTWTTRSAAGDDDDWFALTYASSTFVAVGGYGASVVMTSPDGITWTARSAAGDNDIWLAVTYSSSTFVAVGAGDGASAGDRVMTSPDGITWTARSAAGNDDAWQNVTYGNGLFVAVADSGTDRVMTSPDGITWTARSAAGDNDSWTSVTYNNNLFVAVGEGPDVVMTSPDGITWTARSAAGNDDGWQYVTYGNGLFVAVGGFSTDVVMTSPDGITWTVRSAAGNDDNWSVIVYGNGLFVAAARNLGGSDRVMTSPDGITWTVRSAAGNDDLWYGAAYGNDRFVVVGSATGAGDAAITSVDSKLYFSSTLEQSITGALTGASQLRSVTFLDKGDKVFYSNASTTDFSVATSSGRVHAPAALTVSGNYTNYGEVNHVGFVLGGGVSAAGDNDYWSATTYGNSLFVAVGSGPDVVMTSPDSTTWTARSAAGNDDSWTGVAYANNRFTAVGIGDGFGAGDHVMTSPDGITWTARSAAGNDDYWYSVTYGNGLFVAVGDATGAGDAVMTSPDGITWTARSAAGNDDFWDAVTYGNGLFVAVGTGPDVVMTSPDGITWTARSAAGNDDFWYGVTYGNGLFVAVGDATGAGDAVMTSPDGITWTARSAAGNDDEWAAVTYGNGLFVAGGLSGSDLNMYSPDGITWKRFGVAGEDDKWFGLGYGSGRFVGVGGNTTDRVFTVSDSVLYLDGVDTQTLRGNMTGLSQLRSVYLNGGGGKIFANNASTTDFVIGTSSTTTLPSALSVAGNYTNRGTVNAGSGTVYVAGSNPQTFTGVMTATSSFYSLAVKNNSRVASTTFADAITVGGILQAEGGTYLTLRSGATSTVANLTLNGSSTAPVAFGATATGTQAKFVLTGTPTITYTTIYDNNACGSTGGTIDVSSGNNTDGGNLTCWNFVASANPTLSLGSNQHFYVGQASTTMDTVTITESAVSSITAANDIRLFIATSTTNFRFNTGVTTLTFGGTASAKVANPVSYENNGATLVIPVSSDFSASDTLTVQGIGVGSFGSVSTAAGRLTLHTDGNVVGAATATSSHTIAITGLLTAASHDAGAADNKFSWQNYTDAALYTFKLTPASENATVTDMVFTLRGVQNLASDDLVNLKLYRDTDSDGVVDGTDLLLDGSGIITLSGQNGAITFSADFLSTTSANYIVAGDTSTISPNGALVISLERTGITATGVTSGYTSYTLSTAASTQHIRNVSGGGGGGGDRIGGAPPAGAGTVTGGGSGAGGGADDIPDGQNISPDADFYRPTNTGALNEWTNGSNGYASDGTYATAATNGFRQSYINFGFAIPTGNSIQGISVKLDASGSTAAGTLDVALSWDGGSSYTSAKASPTLSGSDIIYTVGGPSDTWGRTWSASEFSNANFSLRVTANTSSNTLRLDALEIRIHHQASGGGSGGGGGI